MRSPIAPEQALGDLADVLPLVWEALEAGAADASHYFERHGERINATLYPCVVRYRAIQVLEAAGVDASEFARSNIANNGIEILSGRYRLRALKADSDGEVPRAGTSMRKRNFYYQGSLFPTLADADMTNLVVLWDYNQQGITDVSLACPLAPESKMTEVKVAWMVTIPHPAERTPTVPVADEDDEDLPITFRQQTKADEDAG
jgi:hypothetical protein